LRIEDVI
jgi:hypothetical protein